MCRARGERDEPSLSDNGEDDAEHVERAHTTTFCIPPGC